MDFQKAILVTINSIHEDRNFCKEFKQDGPYYVGERCLDKYPITYIVPYTTNVEYKLWKHIDNQNNHTISPLQSDDINKKINDMLDYMDRPTVPFNITINEKIIEINNQVITTVKNKWCACLTGVKRFVSKYKF